MSDISIAIKTFERPGCLNRLLDSIVSRGYKHRVLIADDSQKSSESYVLSNYESLNIIYLTMPFDSGASAGRNHLLENIDTRYFVLCDDDFVFDGRENFDFLKNNLETTGFDLIGGLYYDFVPMSFMHVVSSVVRGEWFLLRQQLARQGIKREFFGNFIEEEPGKIGFRTVPYKSPLTECDLVLNYFMADTKRVRETVGGWDENIKIGGEHEEFFYRASKAGLRVAHTEEAGVLHYQEANDLYMSYRKRAKEMRPEKFKGWFS